jgi:hypothetical protein
MYVLKGNKGGGNRIGEESTEKNKEREIREKYTDSIHHGADQTPIYLSAGQHTSP